MALTTDVSLDPVSVLDGLFTLLKANLPAKLNALDTAYNDGIVLADIDNGSYYKVRLPRYDRYPAMGVSLQTSDPWGEGDTDGGDQGVGFFLSRHTYFLHPMIVSNESVNSMIQGEVAQTRLARTVRGIVEVIIANQQFTYATTRETKTVYLNGTTWDVATEIQERVWGAEAAIAVTVAT